MLYNFIYYVRRGMSSECNSLIGLRAREQCPVDRVIYTHIRLTFPNVREFDIFDNITELSVTPILNDVLNVTIRLRLHAFNGLR